MLLNFMIKQLTRVFVRLQSNTFTLYIGSELTNLEISFNNLLHAYVVILYNI